jgi:hypothetical protein
MYLLYSKTTIWNIAINRIIHFDYNTVDYDRPTYASNASGILRYQRVALRAVIHNT